MLQRTSDLLNTSTAEFKVPPATNAHGYAIDTGTGATESAATIVYASHRTGKGTTTKPRRATGPQMKGDEVLAVKRAKTAVYFKKMKKISTVEAAESAGSNPRYVLAMETLEQSGDFQLMENVRTGCISLLEAAKLVKPLVELKAAFKVAKIVNPAAAVDFFKTPEVKNFIAAAGVVTTEEHFQATIDAYGVDGTLNVLAMLDASKPQLKEVNGN